MGHAKFSKHSVVSWEFSPGVLQAKSHFWNQNIMHEHQPNQRNAAARAFTESLDQLQNILAQEAQLAESKSLSESSRCSNNWFDLNAWEDAAADLDQFFGDDQPLEDGELDEES